MPYAIILKCTNDTAMPILDLWRQASVFETAPSMQRLNYPPHLTLAIYQNISPNLPYETVQKVFQDIPAISVKFSGIRYFRNDFAGVVGASRRYRRFATVHQSIHRAIDPVLCHEHYQPGHWQPHCTIAMNIPMDSAAEALKWAVATPARFSVTFDAADCVRFHPVEIVTEVKLSS
jgi:2'-5' RNA ligase